MRTNQKNLKVYCEICRKKETVATDSCVRAATLRCLLFCCYSNVIQ